MSRALSAPILVALALASAGCPPQAQPPASTGAPTSSASAAPAPSVDWKPKSFVRATEGCTQAWACDCTVMAPRAGCHVEGAKPDATTTGVCAADSGPPTGCTRCMALPPPDACTCHYACP